MVEQSFFTPAGLDTLSAAKEKLGKFRNMDLSSSKLVIIAIRQLKELLKNVARILKEASDDKNIEAAALLLLADIYGTLSFMYKQKGSPASLGAAESSFNEALTCIEKVKNISAGLPEGLELDNEFIKEFNVRKISEPENALRCLIEHLLPSLLEACSNEPLYKVIGSKL